MVVLGLGFGQHLSSAGRFSPVASEENKFPGNSFQAIGPCCRRFLPAFRRGGKLMRLSRDAGVA
jgi:hypothetical protein